MAQKPRQELGEELPFQTEMKMVKLSMLDLAPEVVEELDLECKDEGKIIYMKLKFIV